MSKKRGRREKARLKYLEKQAVTKEETTEKPVHKPKKGILTPLKNLYEKEYKKLMIITFAILILAILQIGYQTAMTGDFIKKGVSLKGGISVTVPDVDYNPTDLENYLSSQFPGNDIGVRTLTSIGGGKSISIEADITKKEDIKTFEADIKEKLGTEDYSIDFIGSSLGQNFFRQTIIAVIIAFILMAIVVILYFRLAIPSLAVILSAFSDIMVTIAIINLIGMKVSTGGIAALLMLIGYSVDTDILLTTRLFRRKEGTVDENIYSSAKTGLTMTFSSIAAVVISIIFSQSDALRQIMIILLIGLMVDIPNTWIQNVGILKWYIEKKGISKKNE